MKRIKKLSNSLTTNTVKNVPIDTKQDSTKTGKSHSRNIRIFMGFKQIINSLERMLLTTPIAKRLITILHLDTNIFKLEFNRNMDSAYKALVDGNSLKLLKSLKCARSNIINDRTRLGKGYGVDDFKQWTGDWVELLKKQSGNKWQELSEKVEDSSSKLTVLSAALEELNGSLEDISDLQRILISVCTIYADTVARAVLNCRNDDSTESLNPDQKPINPYSYWDESKNNSELYGPVSQELKIAIKKM